MSSTSRSETSSSGPGRSSGPSRLEVRGLVKRALSLDRAELAALSAGQVPDVGALVPGKKGRGVRLSALAARAGAEGRALHVHIGSADPAFAVSVPIAEVLDLGIVVYELDGAPYPADKGGPFRLLVPGHADECVNVKQLARLEFAAEPGRDTRPKDDAEHARMHAACRAKPRHEP
jgi:2-dehydropantoate 2-reductase